MIDPKELRIGNLVLYNEDIVLIEGVNYKTVDLFYNKTATIIKCIDFISPILLNENLILNSGFEKGEDYTLLQYQLKKNYDEYEFTILGSNIILAKIKYLHQLQNIFFSLTGSELVINED